MNTQHQRDDADNDKEEIATVGNNTDFPAISLDLTIEILTRLPAKSLLKFRSVSKQWCSIIHSRSFQISFMSRSLSRPRLLLVYDIHQGNKNQLFFLSSSLFPQESKHSSIVSKHDMLNLRTSPRNYMRFCNSVRGIICISLSDNRFLIYNPTTKQVLRIPNDMSGFDPTYNMCFMYLGYDTRKDEYKILSRIMSRYGSVKHSVCTLERGQKQSSFSSWRDIESNIYYYIRYNEGLCINGVVYYGGGKIPSDNFVVVSFDVWSEQLRLIESPKEDDKLGVVKLINYKGKLSRFYVTRCNTYVLRILDDVKNQIWSTKTGVFTPCFRDTFRNLRLRICGTTEAGEIIFVSWNDYEFYFYDLNKDIVRRIVRRITDDNIVRQISISCDHVENIISL